MSFSVGDRIAGTYTVKRIIEGGMSTVYVCCHEEWGLDLVVKIPSAEVLSNPKYRERITVEAEAWTALGLHPHIAYCYYTQQLEGVPLLIIEYLDGGNLRDWIASAGHKSLRVGLDLAVQCCHGLEHAHAHGLVHRDIKPANILLASDGTLKVTDFGIARFDDMAFPSLYSDSSASYSKRKAEKSGGTIGGIGTDEYMAPEQWVDSHDVDARADIFALGVCLYEVFSGRRPYERAVGPRQEPPDLRNLRRRDRLPDRLCSLLRRCVDWERSGRPNTVKEVRNELCVIYEGRFGQPSPWAQLPDVSLEADGWNNRGVSYFVLGQRGEALRCFERAVQSNPVHLEATFNQALLQWRRAEIDDTEALRRLERLIDTPVVEPKALALARAEIHQERFNPTAAIEVLAGYPDLHREYFAGRESSAIALWQTVEECAGEIAAVALGVGGETVVVGGRDTRVRLWQLIAGQTLSVLVGHAGAVLTVALSADGRWVLSGSTDTTARLWDVRSCRCARVLKGHTESVSSVTFSEDARWALSGSDDGTVKLWDLESGQCMRTFADHWDPVTAVALSPSRDCAISGGVGGTLKFWDLSTGACRFTPPGPRSRIRVLAFCGVNERAVSVNGDGTIRVWAVPTGQSVRTMAGRGSQACSAAVSMDGHWAVSGGVDGHVRVWDLETGQCVRTLLGHRGEVVGVAFSADARRLLSAGRDGLAKVWNMNLSRRISQRFKICRPRHFGALRVQQAALDAGLKQITSLSASRKYQEARDLLMSLWGPIGFRQIPRVDSLYGELLEKGTIGALLSIPSKSFGRQENPCGAIGLSADGQRALSGGKDGTLRLWDVESRQCLQIIRIPAHPVWALALSADGLRALSGSDDQTVRLWDLTNGQCMHVLKGHANWVGAVAMAADARRGVSASFDTSIRLWDLEGGRCVGILNGHRNWVNAIAVSPDGLWAISGSGDRTVRLWDLERGRCVHTLEGHAGDVRAIAISSDSRRALSGGYDHPLKLWDLERGRCLRDLIGHTTAITAVAINADGRRGVSAGADCKMRVWDTDTGECLRSVEIASRVVGFALTADASAAVAVHGDGTLTRWRFIWRLEFAPDA